MSAATTHPRITRATEYSIYTRPVRSGVPTEMGKLTSASSGEDGWVFAAPLRLREVRLQQGAAPGWATFDYLSLAGIQPIESMLGRYWADDQVRVIQHTSPVGGDLLVEGIDEDDIVPGSAEPTGLVIFEGVLSRSSITAERSGDDEREEMSITAFAAPEIDNTHPDHTIRGRWIANPDGFANNMLLVDGPSVPPVFNAGGRANMHHLATLEASAGGMVMSASIFTADDDPNAKYWTVQDALLSLLVMWLFGKGATLTRSVALESETFTALTTPAPSSDDRWLGLDARMPAVNVQGLGVFDAIQAVCSAVGYGMAIMPAAGRELPDEASAAPDRLYELRLWRTGSGPSTVIKMMKRETFSGVDEAEVLARNNVSMFEGMRDAADVRNRVVAVGRTYIEATFPLKPMWNASKVDAAEVTDQHGHRAIGAQGDSYHRQHTPDGDLYPTFGYVGRAWGLDCTGQLLDDLMGYTTPALYALSAFGFDFPGFLGIDGSDAISLERADRNVTDPIHWTRRTRQPLPLSRPTIEKLTRGMILEVTEDAGVSWTEIDLKFRVIPGFFGIYLEDQRLWNLATVNIKTFTESATQARPADLDNWWTLIQTEQFQPRLTCRIEADHATRFDAPPESKGTTLYDRMAYLPTEIEETWAAPDSFFNATSQFVKINDTGYGSVTESADRSQTLQDVAERTRDAGEGLRLSATYDTWQMTLAPWRVGDRVLGIQGRNLSLATSAGGAASGGGLRYPTIVGVTLTAWPEKSQGIAVDLDDTAMRRGA